MSGPNGPEGFDDSKKAEFVAPKTGGSIDQEQEKADLMERIKNEDFTETEKKEMNEMLEKVKKEISDNVQKELSLINDEIDKLEALKKSYEKKYHDPRSTLGDRDWLDEPIQNINKILSETYKKRKSIMNGIDAVRQFNLEDLKK